MLNRINPAYLEAVTIQEGSKDRLRVDIGSDVVDATTLVKECRGDREYCEWLSQQIRMVKKDLGTTYSTITKSILRNKRIVLHSSFPHIQVLKQYIAYEATLLKQGRVPEQWQTGFASMFSETVYRG